MCAVAGCDNEAKKDGLCWGHYKRRRQGSPLSTPLAPRGAADGRSARQVLLDASLRHADADAENDAEYDKAVHNLATAAERYARKKHAAKVTEALAARAGRGERLGRPPAPIDTSDLELLELGAARVKDVAEKYAVSRWAVYRAKRRRVAKT